MPSLRITSLALCAALCCAAGCATQPAPTARPAPAVAWTLPPNLGDGWACSGPVREFGPANLHEYNNGAAAAYLDYGFVRLKTTRYAKAAATLVVDVFDMGEARNGFGMYSTIRSRDDEFVAIRDWAQNSGLRPPRAVGPQGCIVEDVLDLWQGRYLVHVAPATAAAVDRSLVLELGRAVAAHLGDKAGVVPELARLPRRGLVPNSVVYYKRNALGIAALRNAFTAAYRIGEKEVLGLAAEYPTAADARSALEGCRRFIMRKGKGAPVRRHGRRYSFAGIDARGQDVIFAAEGPRLAGVMGVTDLRECVELLDALLR